MVFLTEATLAHELGSMKESVSIEYHDVTFVKHSSHCKQGLAYHGPLECHSARNVASTVSFGGNFYRHFSQIVNLFTSRSHVSLSFH